MRVQGKEPVWLEIGQSVRFKEQSPGLLDAKVLKTQPSRQKQANSEIVHWKFLDFFFLN